MLPVAGLKSGKESLSLKCREIKKWKAEFELTPTALIRW